MKTLIFLSLILSNIAFSKDFSKLEKFLFIKPDKNVVTEAFVLAKDGEIVYSNYKRGNENTLHLLWSMSKSVTSLLFGIAQGKGLINSEDSIYKYFKDEIDSFSKARRESLKKIKLKHLLQMSSGLDWKEFYEDDPFKSNVVKMLYLKPKDSLAKYVLETPTKLEPGTKFYYSSGDTNLLTGAMNRAFQKELRSTYPWKWLFDKMEIEAIFERDGAGSFIGSSYLYLKTKDLLKVGNLIANSGKYKDAQIVPKEYIEFATSLSGSLRKRGCLEDSYMTYGSQFWLNTSCPNGKRPFPSVPDTLVMMLGHGGQSVFIFPKHKIVAVRIARDAEKALNKERYAKLILEAMDEN